MVESTHPTWEDAIRIGRELQEKHQIPLFAFTYYKMCSCCASPQDFRVRDFLWKKKGRDAYTDWGTFRALEEKPAYIVFANSSNYRGEITDFSSEFGFSGERNLFPQMVKYAPDYFDETADILQEFVDRMNALTSSGDLYYLHIPNDPQTMMEIGVKVGCDLFQAQPTDKLSEGTYWVGRESKFLYAFEYPWGTVDPMRKIREAVWDYADTCNISITYDGVGYDMIRTIRHDNGRENAFYIIEDMDETTVTFMGNPARTPYTNYVSTLVEQLRFVKIKNLQGVHPDLMSRLKEWGVLIDVHQPAVLKLGENSGYTLCNASSGAVATVLRNAH
jgi:hypothetical protein